MSEPDTIRCCDCDTVYPDYLTCCGQARRLNAEQAQADRDSALEHLRELVEAIPPAPIGELDPRQQKLKDKLEAAQTYLKEKR